MTINITGIPFGFYLEGSEQTFANMLYLANQPGAYVYHEVGIGQGTTLKAVDAILSQFAERHTITGCDVSSYRGDALNITSPDISLALVGSEEFLRTAPPANFIFIDACHGAPCVTREFLQAEQIIKPGGVICFHDTDDACQGKHQPQHCGTGIDVRRALYELGLLTSSRPGWRKVAETHGDQSIPAHGCVFVQRNLS